MTKNVAVSLDEDLEKEIREQANIEHRNFSNMVQHALIEYLKRNRENCNDPD